MASAPPEPPSPVMVTTMGTGRRAISRKFRAMASAWPRSSASMPGIGARRINESENGPAKFRGQLHDAQRLAIAFGLGLPEILRHALLGVAALLLADQHDGTPVEARETRHHRRIVAIRAVAVQFVEIFKQDAHVIHHVGTLRMARQKRSLPRAHVLVKIVPQLRDFAAQAVQFGGGSVRLRVRRCRSASSLSSLSISLFESLGHIRFARMNCGYCSRLFRGVS